MAIVRCLGMKIGNQMEIIVIQKQASSLYSPIADGQYRGKSLGRDAWKALIGPFQYCRLQSLL